MVYEKYNFLSRDFWTEMIGRTLCEYLSSYCALNHCELKSRQLKIGAKVIAALDYEF